MGGLRVTARSLPGIKFMKLAILASLVVQLLPASQAFAVTEHCEDGGVKVEGSSGTFSGGKEIDTVCIKAGTATHTFTRDGSDGCYTVSGLGTHAAEVLGGGTSKDCKEISYVVFYEAQPPPPPI